MEVKFFGIGVGEECELLYRIMLSNPRRRVHELAQLLDISDEEVLQQLSVLRNNGLAVDADDGCVRAVEPCIALPLLMMRRINEPQETRPSPAAIERFIALHERTGDISERRTGDAASDQLAILVERMVSKVENKLVFLVPGPSHCSVSFSRPIVETALRRHASVLTLWDASVLRDPAAAAHAEWLDVQGVPVRTAAKIPVRAVIMDDVVAVVVDESGRHRVLRAPEEVRRLSAIADRMWERGMAARAPKRAHPVRRTSTRPRSELVLRLLAEGLTDDAIARRLGCSVRTVRNDVACAMAALNARSRFQAGVRAMQVGLI